MGHQGIYSVRILALVLLLLICITSLSACKASGSDHLETAVENSLDNLAQELTLLDAKPEELEQLLSQLPHLKKLTLDGNIPPYETLLELHAQFPDLEMVFPVAFGEKIIISDVEVLDLSGIEVDPDTIAKQLSLFFHLRELTLLGTNLTDEEKM